VTGPDVSLSSVTSDEPDNGQGDGNTENDIVIGENNCFLLRSESGGATDGYTPSPIVPRRSGEHHLWLGH
jgi:hypothetical protein